MPDDLYDRDILTWSEQQSELLRRLARGERVNDAVDWPHVIEELADVGISELRACESLLRQAMLHLLKLRCEPHGPAAHWRSEVVGFLSDGAARFTPSMRQRIDLDALYRRAVRQVAAAGEAALPALPTACPFTLDELLDEKPDLPRLLERLAPAM